MVQREPADLEREAAELAQTLERRAGRLPEEFITALKGRMDEVLLEAATLRYATEQNPSRSRTDSPSRGL